MDTFICPLKWHPDENVRRRVTEILCKKINPNSEDVEQEFKELASLIKNSKSENDEYAKKSSNSNASVNNTKESASVNSAHGSAHKSLKAKIEREKQSNINSIVAQNQNVILTQTHMSIG